MRQLRLRGRRRSLVLIIVGLFFGSFAILDFTQRTSPRATSAGTPEQLVISTKLRTRVPWEADQECSQYNISHLVPKSRPPCALASYPGSGNTWVRQLIEGATGVFTGSRYKDLQIQMYGLWGEIRDWQDGTTIVQKTHDSHPNHVKNDFGGRGILILRNPYDAVLSDHNFLFGGHMGVGPPTSFDREDWSQFVSIEAESWLSLALHWVSSAPRGSLLVLHYEQVKNDLENQMLKILRFLGVPADQGRLACLLKHRNGFFRRKSKERPESLPFSKSLRTQMDLLIDNLSQYLITQGYEKLPTDLYKFYKKSDEDIVDELKAENIVIRGTKEKDSGDVEAINPNIGTKMVIDQYFRWLEEDKSERRGPQSSDDIKTLLMRKVYGGIKKYSNQDTITGLSERAEKILSYAVELWPTIQKPFQKDPISEVIESKGGNVKSILELAQNITNL